MMIDVITENPAQRMGEYFNMGVHEISGKMIKWLEKKN
jgi:hypothetical protein